MLKTTFDRYTAFVFAAALCLCACVAHSQTVSPFMALGNAQFIDNNGNLLTAGMLYSYQAGTTTQQATYTDYTGLSQNPNPIPFGSGARASIWLTSTASYKFVLCLQNDGSSCAPSDVLFSVDHVPGCMGCSTGANTFTGTFISGTPNPATTGILELASIDSICWRNTANNANLCISKDTSDVLTWTGAVIKLPETGCLIGVAGEDYICPNSATHHLSMNNNNGGYESSAGVATAAIFDHLAGFAPNGIDLLDSGATPPISIPVPFSATPTFTAASQDQLFTMTLSGNVASSTLTEVGAAIPSLVTFELTQDATGSRTFVWPTNVIGGIAPTAAPGSVTLQHFVWDGANARSVTLAAVIPAVLASSITQLGGNVAVPASTNTTVMTKSVTMPASGCPCRVFGSYGMYLQTGNAGIAIGWITDGTNNFATSQVLVTGSSSNYGANGTSFSPTTYANNAAVTFTLTIEASNSGGINVLQQGNLGASSPQSTWMNIAVEPSN